MLRILALGALLFTVTGKPIEDTSPLIINGTTTSITEIPYQVSLEDNGICVCGGSIINREFVLTAAHCVKGVDRKLKVRAGSTIVENGGSLHNVKNIYAHDGYVEDHDDEALIYDIALLRISPNFQINENITKIPLYTDEIPEKAKVTVSGWGGTDKRSYMYPLVLKSGNISVVSKTECLNYYDDLPERVFCAGGAGSGVCKGDSGGPVAFNGSQVGIVSYGDYPCGEKPSVFTKVSDYISWIESYTQESNVEVEVENEEIEGWHLYDLWNI